MKTPTSVRLSEKGRYLLVFLSHAKGISQAALIEMMLREEEKKEKRK